MAIETRFVHVTATFLIIILASAPLALGGAEPDPAPNDIVEEAALPPAPDDDAFDPSLVQQPDDEPGSVAIIPDAESEVAIELAPWPKNWPRPQRRSGRPTRWW